MSLLKSSATYVTNPFLYRARTATDFKGTTERYKLCITAQLIYWRRRSSSLSSSSSSSEYVSSPSGDFKNTALLFNGCIQLNRGDNGYDNEYGNGNDDVIDSYVSDNLLV